MAEISRLTSGDEDRRVEERRRLILRVGVLEQGSRASFCLVRNISASGLQVKLFTSAIQVGQVIVRVADEAPISGQVVWIENGVAGVSFENRIAPSTLLRLQQKLRPIRRRAMPRIKATSFAAVRIDGRNVQAVLRDISSMGARITTSRSLRVGAAALTRFPGLPEIRASVRWTEGSESGLVFETPIPVHVMGEWIDGRLRVSA